MLILGRNGSVLEPFLSSLAKSKVSSSVYDITDDLNVALQKISSADADCLILDMSIGREDALNELKQLRSTAPGVHIIACFDQQLTAADTKQIQPLANAIIGPSVQAGQRLLDEVEHFLKRVDQPGANKVPEKLDPDSDNILAGRTVLLADDDMRNIYALSALLEGHGMHILAAEHGKEAIDMLAQNPKTDLILMDVMMPEMDGYEAMQLIRQDPKHAALPIIALTAKAMLGDREKCLAAGASDYITKPVNNQQLLSLIKVWLSAK